MTKELTAFFDDFFPNILNVENSFGFMGGLNPAALLSTSDDNCTFMSFMDYAGRYVVAPSEEIKEIQDVLEYMDDQISINPVLEQLVRGLCCYKKLRILFTSERMVNSDGKRDIGKADFIKPSAPAKGYYISLDTTLWDRAVPTGVDYVTRAFSCWLDVSIYDEIYRIDPRAYLAGFIVHELAHIWSNLHSGTAFGSIAQETHAKIFQAYYYWHFLHTPRQFGIFYWGRAGICDYRFLNPPENLNPDDCSTIFRYDSHPIDPCSC